MAARLQRSLTSISQSWPQDYLRPTLQFSGAILAASSRIFATPAPASAALPTSSTSALPPAATARPTSTAGELESGAQVAGGALSDVQLRKAEQMVASLENLLENKAFKAYPITDKTLKPASFPKHYSRLLDGVAAAKRGEMERPGLFSFIRWK